MDKIIIEHCTTLHATTIQDRWVREGAVQKDRKIKKGRDPLCQDRQVEQGMKCWIHNYTVNKKERQTILY
jgi:hypothetical protein